MPDKTSTESVTVSPQSDLTDKHKTLKWLRKQINPLADRTRDKIKADKVYRVYEVNSRGLTEILFSHGETAWTAFAAGPELIYLEEGW